MKRSRRAAFTYIELGVILVVLVLFAMAVMPNLFSVAKSSDRRTFVSELEALPGIAREAAIRTGQVHELIFEEDSGRFIVQRQDETQSTPVASVSAFMSPSRFVSDDNDTGPGDWLISFYPDGTSDGGGVEFDAGGIFMTLLVDRQSGLARFSDEDLENLQQSRWEAGTIEQRTQTTP